MCSSDLGAHKIASIMKKLLRTSLVGATAALLALAFLAGCGQKGPLELPKAAASSASAPAR